MRILALIFFFTLLVPTLAYGDGKVFTRHQAVANIPDQSALIHWEAGQETLIIDTSFAAPGNDFAWIVPTPSVPEVFPVSRGVFPTLRQVFAPRVVSSDAIPRLGLLFAIIALTAWLLLFHRKVGFMFVVLLALIVGLLMPNLGSQRTASLSPGDDGSPPVTVHQFQRIGSYDTAVLSARDADSLAGWLKDQQFELPESLKPGIAYYVSQGWCFVASKLHREADTSEPTRPHPLGLRFAAVQAVYPLRLTGIGNQKCEIQLFVFGQDQAIAPPFQVTACDQVVTTLVDRDVYFFIPIVHAELAKLRLAPPEHGDDLLARTAPPRTGTLLTATLTPEQMREDLYLR